MRLRPPPITGQTALDGYLRDIYQAIVQINIPFGVWEQVDVPASQTSVTLPLLGTSTLGSSINTELTVPFDGNVVGISVASNAARTAGTLTVVPVINGTASTSLSAVLDGTNTTYDASMQRHEKDPFRAAQALGVEITTDSSWAPTTADIVVTLFVKPGSPKLGE